MKKVVMIVLAVAVMGFGSNASAGWGRGGGNHGQGMGMGMGNECPAMQNLSAEDMEKVTAERNAFFESVDPIRDQIRQKHFELRTEMSRSPADNEKISALENEISVLRTQMDEKRTQFQENLKKINPELADCPMGGSGGMGGHGWRHGQHPGSSSGKGMSL